MHLRNCAVIHVDSKFSSFMDIAEAERRQRRLHDEGSSIESVEIEKHLTREREDFLGGYRGTQLVDNRVSELC